MLNYQRVCINSLLVDDDSRLYYTIITGDHHNQFMDVHVYQPVSIMGLLKLGVLKMEDPLII